MNRPGIFFSYLSNEEPFLGVPHLNSITVSKTTRVYVYLPTTPENSSEEVSDVMDRDRINIFQTSLTHFRDIIDNETEKYGTHLSDNTQMILEAVKLKLEFMEKHISNITNIDDFGSVLKQLKILYSEEWKPIEDDIALFKESIRDTARALKHYMSEKIVTEKEKVLEQFNSVTIESVRAVFPSLSIADGFLLGFKGGLEVSGFKLAGLQLELVYSIAAFRRCKDFKIAYDILKYERAVRVFGFATSEIDANTELHRFITLRKSAENAIGFAISLEQAGKFALQIPVEVRILGTEANADMLLTNNGLYFYLKGNVWNISKAQMTVRSGLNEKLQGSTLVVQGEFVADADESQNFQAMFSSALSLFTRHIADEADARIALARENLVSAQTFLSVAQNWQQIREKELDKANSRVNSAKKILKSSSEALVRAMKPFEYSFEKLKNAQDSVNRLCWIKSCYRLCIPGIKCFVCWKTIFHSIKVRSSCCRSERCFFIVPYLRCVASNFYCGIARKLAFTVMEANETALPENLKVFDVSKTSVLAALLVVEKSRVILDLATLAVDVANHRLDIAQRAFETAQYALASIKTVVRLGLIAKDYIKQYGKQSIIDVQNCSFEVALSMHDIAVFNVYCKLNAFKLGFTTVKVRINFTDIHHSVRNAAKATVTALLKSADNIISDRKRRELNTKADQNFNTFSRFKQDDDVSGLNLNKSFDNFVETTDLQNGTDGDDESFRKEGFEIKCKDFRKILQFLFGALHALDDLFRETATTLLNVSNTLNEINRYPVNNTFSDMTFKEIGIDPRVAENEFNMSIDQLQSILNKGKENLSMYVYVNDIDATYADAKEVSYNQVDEVNNANVVNEWIVAMENHTTDYFEPDICVSFLDCVYYSIYLLYDMYMDIESNMSLKNGSLHKISEFKNMFLNLTSNVTVAFYVAKDLAGKLNDLLRSIEALNMFCSTPPQILDFLVNKTLKTGQTLTLVCNVSADPLPTFQWFRDNEILANFSSMVLNIFDVDKNHTGWYHCVASNLVAKLTFPSVFINITGKALLLNVIKLRFIKLDFRSQGTSVLVSVQNLPVLIYKDFLSNNVNMLNMHFTFHLRKYFVLVKRQNNTILLFQKIACLFGKNRYKILQKC